MTEDKLRQKVADIMNGWIGAVRGDYRHAAILSAYNNHKPLAMGYAVQLNDAYCATTASAAYILAGISDYTGTECSVPRWITEAQKRGIWVENDGYRPRVGDAICYDWQDDGQGDCVGSADHIGIVVAVSGDAITVTEGNINGGKVGQRCLMVNARYIRGYICPPFAEIANEKPETKPIDEIVMEVIAGLWGAGADREAALTAAGYDYAEVQAAVTAALQPETEPPAPPWYAEAQAWAVDMGISDGTNPDGPATRAQVWTMLWRFMQKIGGDDP